MKKFWQFVHRHDGTIMPVDDRQTELFLKETKGIRVLPWIGGVIDADVTPDLPARRKIFVQSAVTLLRRHPDLAGVHLNVEPWPSGHSSLFPAHYQGVAIYCEWET